MTEKQYRKHPFVSNSGLTYVKNLILNIDTPPNPEYFRVGSLVDQMILTPSQVDVNHTLYNEANEIYNGFIKHCPKSIQSLIEISLSQFPDFDILDFKEFTINAKCLHDSFNQKLKTSIDIKTTECKTKKAFIEACKYFDYDRQSYWYHAISRTVKSYIIGISKQYPHDVFILDAEINLQMSTEGKQKAKELAYAYKTLFII
jgi:hypothetical protein